METAPQDTRTALLQAALVCFAENGFDGTSLRMIADRAKRPLSLLGHHFGNKEGLYVEVFKLIFDRGSSGRFLDSEGGQAWAPRDKADAIRAIREQIHLMYQDVVPWVEGGQGDPVRSYGPRLWLREMQSPRPELHPLLRQFLGPTKAFWQKCIKMLRPELTEPEVVYLGISVIGIVVSHGHSAGVNRVLWGMAKPLANDFQASELLVDLCLNGLLGDRSI